MLIEDIVVLSLFLLAINGLVFVDGKLRTKVGCLVFSGLTMFLMVTGPLDRTKWFIREIVDLNISETQIYSKRFQEAIIAEKGRRHEIFLHNELNRINHENKRK